MSAQFLSQKIFNSSLISAEYGPTLVILIVGLGLACVIFGLSASLSTASVDVEKLSAYECGFDPFEDARNTFDVRFYLVAILFIIFDLEVAFMLPWSVQLASLSSVGFWSMMVFLVLLTVGFVYEWRKGALEWE
jgi:NADH-quinone oxidoreductase subunit A